MRRGSLGLGLSQAFSFVAGRVYSPDGSAFVNPDGSAFKNPNA